MSVSAQLARPVLALTAVAGLALSIVVAQRELALPFPVMVDELRLLDLPRLGQISDQPTSAWAPSNDQLAMNYAQCEKQKTQTGCAQLLRKILNRKPTDGALWLSYAGALAREGDGDITAMDALRHSYKLAPKEKWVSDTRSSFALSIWGGLPNDVRQLARAEIVERLDDRNFLILLAQKYVASPFAHAAIEDALSNATPQQKLLFLNQVRTAAQLGG